MNAYFFILNAMAVAKGMLGLLQGKKVTKEWVSSPFASFTGTCLRCWRFDGDKKDFLTGFWFTLPSDDPNVRGRTSAQILFCPPAHPNCRCRIEVDWGEHWWQKLIGAIFD